MTDKKKVLVTGASGYIANQLLPAFKERYDLTLIDVKPKESEKIIIADLRQPEACQTLFQGINAIVHLGFHRGERGQEFEAEMTNIRLAHNVYKLASDSQVQRVVVASSNHASDWYERIIHKKQLEMLYPHSDPFSDNYYGWAKLCYEKEGFIFASGAFGRKLEVVQIRIGAPREIKPQEDPIAYNRSLGAYISPKDLQQLFIKSIETPNIENEYGIPFQVFYGISDNSRKFWSIANARKAIDYQPLDNSEVKFAEDIAKYWTTKFR